MAKDATNKPTSSNNSGNSSPPDSDQQKVPPLRIVLNTSGNQKSSSTTLALSVNQQADLKRAKSQDVKADQVVKTGGRVRIKLGTNKQVNKAANESSLIEDAEKLKSTSEDDNSLKEDIAANYNYLRRITRRSQRTIQTLGQEDEESMTSMTSTDENQATTNDHSDINSTLDVATAQPTVTSSSSITASTSTATSTTASTSTSTAVTSVTNSTSETSRRYKRRKGEPSESSFIDHEGLFSYQNYKLPNQNSFELYRNIRKQVDKRLKNLNSIHPKTPYGFRDYMLTRGTYLLDGNKLGNGTNLFMDEDGGLHPAPIAKYAFRHNRVHYTVPNRAKVPLGLPVSSPLYNLFIDQEKERYRMRIQHIKEREKLTLAAEQEIVRVYNQAALAAANQPEPFSACTLLKHQEIYDYLDNEGRMIQSSEDAQQDDVKQDGVRTRRRHHEPISPPPVRKNSNADEAPPVQVTTKEVPKTVEFTTSLEEPEKSNCSPEPLRCAKETKNEKEVPDVVENGSGLDKEEESDAKLEETEPKVDVDLKSSVDSKVVPQNEENSAIEIEKDKENDSEVAGEGMKDGDTNMDDISDTHSKSIATSEVQPEPVEMAENSEIKINDSTSRQDSNEKCRVETTGQQTDTKQSNEPTTELIAGVIDDKSDLVPMDHENESSNLNQDQVEQPIMSEGDKQACNKEAFLSQLQNIDDKWDKIRSEMLIRHRNEAESLYAVQKLEWEWKTKEIGVCDVRAPISTPVIDNTLVPKLIIYSQDY